MDEKIISEAAAKNIVLEKLKEDLQGDIELIEYSMPTEGLAYALNGRDPVNFYFFHVKSPKPAARLLTNVNVQKEIARRQAEINEKDPDTVDRIRETLNVIAFTPKEVDDSGELFFNRQSYNFESVTGIIP